MVCVLRHSATKAVSHAISELPHLLKFTFTRSKVSWHDTEKPLVRTEPSTPLAFGAFLGCAHGFDSSASTTALLK
jgi:hypothetical protein